MYTRTKLKITLLSLVLLAGFLSTTQAQDTAEPFMGRWALHLPGGAGWLNVHDDKGYLDAELLWYGGSVLPVSGIHIADGVLTVTRQSRVVRHGDDTGKTTRTHILTNRLELLHADGMLHGKAIFPNRDGMGESKIKFNGTSIADLPPAPDMSAVKYGEPITLFNGIDLSGWSSVRPERENGWMVEDGALVNDPVQPDDGDHVNYANLRTDDTFEDFRLVLQVNIPEGSNSGVYLRGIYEIQVMDSYGMPLDSHHMGGLYSRVAPSSAAEKPAGEWQDMDITLVNRHVTVVLNGTKIIDNQPALGVTGGALTADQFSAGPIYLQGDHGRVMYRDIVLTPIAK